MDDEVPLHGGFSTEVVRAGATVRRSASPWTASVHAVLRREDRGELLRAGPR